MKSINNKLKSLFINTEYSSSGSISVFLPIIFRLFGMCTHEYIGIRCVEKLANFM